MGRKILRLLNGLITFVVTVGLLAASAYAGYALWDNQQVYDTAESVFAELKDIRNTIQTPTLSAMEQMLEESRKAREEAAAKAAQAEAMPTQAPTAVPAAEPTHAPTAGATAEPTQAPTAVPTEKPTQVPTTVATEKPTQAPAETPTAKPAQVPAAVPAAQPTRTPTVAPTGLPMQEPTEELTSEPAPTPAEIPTATPTAEPTEEPTSEPTPAPTEEPTPTPTPTPTAAPTEVPTPEPTPDNSPFGQLKQINKDITAWLTLPGTAIDYPVLQGPSNYSYINTDVYGNFALAGSIFLDSRNDSEYNDLYSLLYGHNMSQHRMFSDINLYKDEEFFNENRLGMMLLPNGCHVLENISVIVAPASDSGLFNPENWNHLDAEGILKMAQENALYTCEDGLEALKAQLDLVMAAEAAGEDAAALMPRIVSLSTCSDEFTDARTILLTLMDP